MSQTLNLRWNGLLIAALLAIPAASFAQTANVTLQAATSPVSAVPGNVVAITGSGFPTGTIQTSGVQVLLANGGNSVSAPVTAVTTVAGSTRRISFQIPLTVNVAVSTPYTVSLSGTTTTNLLFTSSNTATVNVLPPPQLTSLGPNTGAQGATIAVKVQATGTNFVQGATVANFGAGIAVGGAASGANGPVTVTSTTTATASITIDAAAAVGARNVTLQTGSVAASLANGFTVTQATTTPPPPLTLTSPTTPPSARPGDPVTVSGVNFPTDTITADKVSIRLEPQTAGAGPLLSGIAATNINTATGSTRSVTFIIPTTLNVTTPLAYLVSITGQTAAGAVFASSNKAALTVNPLGVISSLNPASAGRGSSPSITISGQNTNWTTGATVSFGSDITVRSVTVSSVNSLVANLTIPATATIGAHDVTVTSNGQTTLLAKGFNVTSGGTPVLTSLSLAKGTVGQGYTVGVSGFNTGFLQGTTSVSFGAGITVSLVTVQSPTSLLANINIAPAAIVGTRDVVVTTGGEVVTLQKAFTINAPVPQITITSPTSQTLFGTASALVTGTVSDPQAQVVVSSLDKNNNVISINASIAGGTFQATVTAMREGNNLITATATNVNRSAGSASVSVNLDTTPPIVAFSSPSDGAILTSSTVNVAGNVNDIVTGTVNAEQVTVSINGLPATVSHRSFQLPAYNLVPGPNVLKATATDQAGNVATAQLTVTLQNGAGQQTINIVSGDNQTSQILTPLSQPLTAQLLDGYGNPVQNRPVTFTVQKGDGSVASITASGASVTTLTDDKGLAAVNFTLGSRVGSGINQVSATSIGFIGETVFHANTTVGAAFQITGAGVMGENLAGPAGKPLSMPFIVMVTDRGGNPVPGVNVGFTVESGGGSLDGSAAPVTRSTDSNGKASSIPTLGAQEGINNNRFSAVLQNSQLAPVILAASGVVEGASADTTISGIVLDNQNNPVPNATAKIVGTALQARSDQQGRFKISAAPVGTVVLIVDGATSTRPETFPFLAFQIQTFSGKDNTVGGPIFLPILDASNSIIVGGSQDVVLTMKGVPGVAFTVFANSVTFPDGSHTGPLSLSQVLSDKVPMAPANGTTPKVVWTLQPAGTKFNPPIRVQLPNSDGLTPGQVIETYQFDHDLEQWVSVGTSRVSADASVIVSDPGFGITKAGWGHPAPPPPPKRCLLSCGGGDQCSTSVLQDPPCQCVSQPANQGARCGDAPGVYTACRSGGKCGVNGRGEGACIGGVSQLSGSCDDSKFCTTNDTCDSGGNCHGTDKPDVKGPALDHSLTEQFKQGYQAVQGFATFLHLPVQPPALDISFTEENNLKCCEDKKLDNLEESKMTFTFKMANWDTGRLVLQVPPYSGNFEETFFGHTIGVAYGISVDLNANISVSGSRAKRECQSDTCWSAALSGQAGVSLALFAAVANPFAGENQCGEEGAKRPCALFLLEGAAQASVTAALTVGCDESAFKVTFDGLKIVPKLQIGEGTLFEYSLSAPPIPVLDPITLVDSQNFLR